MGEQADGSVDPRWNGSTDPRRDGSVDPRRDGSTNPRWGESRDPRRDGSAGPRRDESASPRRDGSVGSRRDGSTNPRRDESTSPQPDGSASAQSDGWADVVGDTAARVGSPDPDTDRPGQVGTSDLTRPTWRYAIRKTFREFQADDVSDLAAALTFWAVLAVAPAALALVSLLGLVGDGERIVTDVLDSVGRLTPELDLKAVEPLVESLASQQRAGLVLIGGLLVALWSASGYVNAFARAMNRIYEVDEGRPIWKLRPVMLLVTGAIMVLAATICVAMVLSGPVAEEIGARVGLSDLAVALWEVAKWPLIVGLVALAIAILYHATPNVRQPRFRGISVGSFVAILVWALATLGFGLYVARFGRHGETYGALAGVAVFLLWLWLTNNALLFGAELDAELERARQLQAGIEAEETIQLPPRDSSASSKREERSAQDLRAGRILRLTGGLRSRPPGHVESDPNRQPARDTTRESTGDPTRGPAGE